MRKSEPLNVLAKLFSYLTDESFLDGRSWALAQLREHSVELYQDISLFDHNQSQPLAGQHTDSTLLLIYSAQYFNARIMIENSYHYRDANQMIKLACAALAQVSDGINSEFIQALSRFSQLQHWLCEIDRGIYNSYADTLAVASG